MLKNATTVMKLETRQLQDTANYLGAGAIVRL